MNSRFFFIWARMNHFEMRLMLLSQKIDSKLLKMASLLKNFDEENKNKKSH